METFPFASLLVARMEALHLTDTVVGAAVGKSAALVSSWRRGESTPRAPQYQALGAVLAIPWQDVAAACAGIAGAGDVT